MTLAEYSTMSSKRPLSLTNSLIHQDLITFYTFLRIRTQRTINHQIDFTT